MRLNIVPCDLANVFALIAVVRERRLVVAAQLAYTRLHRANKAIDLRASVVVVELAVYGEALPFQQPCYRVADGGAAPVTDVQRSGGVGGDEFHDDLFRRSRRSPPVTNPFGEHALHHRTARC